MHPSSSQDFDFLIGRWQVRHRRLQGRLIGSTTWQAFDGTCTMWTILGGNGNVDDNVLDFPDGPYRAATVRAFDPQTCCWSIWWLDERRAQSLDVPVVGRFENGTGIFHADDMLDGRPVRVRFRWTETRTAAPQWEQAFSPDGGQTWETNWTMHFTRPGADA